MEKQKLYIDLDKAVHRRLRAKSRREKISMAAMFRRAIEKELETEKPKKERG